MKQSEKSKLPCPRKLNPCTSERFLCLTEVGLASICKKCGQQDFTIDGLSRKYFDE